MTHRFRRLHSRRRRASTRPWCRCVTTTPRRPRTAPPGRCTSAGKSPSSPVSATSTRSPGAATRHSALASPARRNSSIRPCTADISFRRTIRRASPTSSSTPVASCNSGHRNVTYGQPWAVQRIAAALSTRKLALGARQAGHPAARLSENVVARLTSAAPPHLHLKEAPVANTARYDSRRYVAESNRVLERQFLPSPHAPLAL